MFGQDASSLRRLASPAAILLFCSMFGMMASAPLHLDNMDFPAVAQATAQTGKPIYYRGEENPHHSGLYHPPLYIYLLAAWFQIFGFGEAQARIFGMWCALTQGWVVLLLMQTLFGRAARLSLQPWFWFLFLLNPYTLQTASVLDIDSTIYGPLIGLVLLLAIRLSWREGDWREDEPGTLEYLFVAAALAAALWAKLTTVLLVIPFLFLLLIARFGWWRAARISLSIVIAGVAGFACTYYAFGFLLGLDVNFTFSFTLDSLLTRGTTASAGFSARLADYSRNFDAMIPFMFRWTGLIPWIASTAAIIVAGSLAVARRQRRAQHYCLLLLLAWLTVVFYCAKVQTFGGSPFKYVFVYWGFLLAALIVLAQGHDRWFPPEGVPCRSENCPRRLPAWGSLAAGVSFVLAAMYGRYIAGDAIILNARPIDWASYGPAIVLLASLLWHVLSRTSRREYARIPLIAAVSVYAGLQLGTALFQVQTPYSKTYDYGQSGIVDAASFVKQNTTSDETIASMKDLGFRAGRRYYETYGMIYGGLTGAEALIALIKSETVKFAVFTEDRGQDQLIVNPDLLRWIQANCVVVESFGNYRIYEYKPPEPVSAPR